MLTYRSGDIFSSECDLLVNPTNSVGVMGAGLAKQFASKFSDECAAFNDYCISYQVANASKRRDKPLLVSPMIIGKVLMFPTKIHWKNSSKIEYIESNLKAARELVIGRSVAFPLLGCGLGGLTAADVIGLIESIFGDHSNSTEVWR